MNIRKTLFTFGIFTLTFGAVAFASDGATATTTAVPASDALASFGASLGAALAIGLAAFGGALGQARTAAAALEAIGRNPAAQNKVFVPMIIGLALIESLVLYAFVIAFIKIKA